MAYNPFHAFRKHQKTVFAALTIVCMLTFVLASGVSGGGDFFSELTRWVSGRARANSVAQLYGKSIDAREIVLLREQRLKANQYMAYAVGTAQANIMKAVNDVLPQLTDEFAKQQLQSIISAKQFASYGYEPLVQQYTQKIPQFLRELSLLQDKLTQDKKDSEARKIRNLAEMLQRDFWQFQQHDELYVGRPLYFGGSTSLEALLDFLIWRHEADRLGIVLSEEEIKKLINNETMQRLRGEQDIEIQRALNLDRFPGGQAALVQALGEEFRVRLAQAALTGYDSSGFIRVPAPVTPDELWDYYRKNRTEVNVKLLPVPASQFVSQVKEKPTTEELKDLFEKYKEEEPSPSRETPGFKLPRRVRVEWIEADPKSPHYQKAVRQLLLGEAAMSVSDRWAGLALTMPYIDEYERAKFGLYGPELTQTNLAETFAAYAYLRRPGAPAGVVGQVLSMAGTGSTPWAIAAALPAVASAREANEVAPAVAQELAHRRPLLGKIAAAMIGLGATGASVTVAGVWDQAARGEQYLPLDLVKREIATRVSDRLAQELVTSSLDAFKKELEGQRTGKQEAFVKEQIAKFGWKTGASSQLDSRFDIAEDKGLQPLREAYLAQRKFDDPRAKRFADQFLDPRPDGSKLYAPAEMRGENEAVFMYWRTADKPPETLTFEEARAKVEQAWYLEKARALAKAEAEKILNAAKGKGDPVRNMTDAAGVLKQPVVELDAVARLKKTPMTRADLGGDYQPFQIPEEKVEYPGSNFVNELLNLTTVGDVAIIADQPKNTYYVAALTARHVPTVKEFYTDTRASLFQGPVLLNRLEQERRKAYREEALAQLRTQARLEIIADARRLVEERGSGGGLEE